MEPLKESFKAVVRRNNPQMDPEAVDTMLGEYEKLLSQKFRINPETTGAKGLDTKFRIERRIEEIQELLLNHIDPDEFSQNDDDSDGQVSTDVKTK